MARLSVGDRIRLFGGYDYEPEWLHDRPEHFAKVLSFFDNGIEGRDSHSRLSASIEFEQPIEYKGLTGRFGFMMGRWEGQTWDPTGVVHLHLSAQVVGSASDVAAVEYVWLESHASYEVVAA